MYYLMTKAGQTGPYHIQQLRSMWASGAITADILCWMVGWSHWVSVTDLLVQPEFSQINGPPKEDSPNAMEPHSQPRTASTEVPENPPPNTSSTPFRNPFGAPAQGDMLPAHSGSTANKRFQDEKSKLTPSAEEFSRMELWKIADYRQNMILIYFGCVLFGVLAGPAAYPFLSLVSIASFLLVRSLHLRNAWLWALGTFLPLVFLVIPWVLYAKATRTLKAAGIKIGFLGRAKKQILNLR